MKARAAAPVLALALGPIAEAFRQGIPSTERSASSPRKTTVARPSHRASSARGEEERRDDATSFHPLGPPSDLSDLAVGNTVFSEVGREHITRLSRSPDIFLVKDLIPAGDRRTLMRAAADQGMTAAGTRNSDANTVRKNSQLAWIEMRDVGDGDDAARAASVAWDAIVKSKDCFSHEAMDDGVNNFERMQVAKYDKGGWFDYHHDGFSRYLTVITYLNSVGGTYFPFGDMGGSRDGCDFTNEDEARDAGKCGILIVGEEGEESYLNSTSSAPSVNPKTIVDIEAGDTVAFYSRCPDGGEDSRSLHCSLTVPQEKWISPCAGPGAMR